MAGRIPDETLQAIRERVSIVEVISGYVSLKKAGRNHLGLCPFHAEKTPSFTVSDERGLFHCFGCGAGGSVFTFLMRADRLEFPEAVEVLARRAGVPLPTRANTDPGSPQRTALIEINEAAQRYYCDALRAPSGRPARLYLEKRGVSAATVERYGLGFCPPGGSGLARALAAKRFVPRMLTDLGLVGRRADGTFYDRFWGRVTFPIRDGNGHILGFGGRTLGTEQPKYLNSPESSLFHKGQVLYGLFEARSAIREAERVVLVEGYLDALALVEAGIGHVVATLGTALTAAQLRLARRFAAEVVAFFDGDRAGQEAAVRAFAVCAETGVWGLGAFLPDGFDPDSFVRSRGAAATTTLLQEAVPLADFFIDRLSPGRDASIPARARAAEQIASVLGKMRDAAQSSLLVTKAAQRLGIDESVFRDFKASPAVGVSGAPTAAPRTRQETDVFRAEEMALLEAMALDQEAARLVVQRGMLDALQSPVLAAAGRALAAAWEQHHSTAAVLDQLPATLAARVTAGLLGGGPVATGDRLQIARDCMVRIEDRAQRARARDMRAKLQHAETSGDDDDYREQLKRTNEGLPRKEIRNGS